MSKVGEVMLGHFDPHLSQVIIDEETCDVDKYRLAAVDRDSQATSAWFWIGPARSSSGTGRRTKVSGCNSVHLIAGTYASTREVARILRRPDSGRLLQEGSREKIFTEAVGDQWLVSMIFGRHTHLGLVKVLCSRATMDLQQVLIRAMERQQADARIERSGSANRSERHD